MYIYIPSVFCTKVAYNTSTHLFLQLTVLKFLFKKRCYVFSIILVCSKNERKMQKYVSYSLSQQMYSFPHYQCLSSQWYISYNWWPYMGASLSLKTHSYILGLTFGIVHFMGLNKCVMVYTYHCRINAE
jgi:hypothetical protein